MSGGSFEYLYMKSPLERADSARESLEAMEREAREEGFTVGADRLKAILEQEDEAQAEWERCAEFMRSFEWWRSGDYGRDQVAEDEAKLVERKRADGPVYFFGCMKGAYGDTQAGHYFYNEPPDHERGAPQKGARLGEGVLSEAIRDGGKIDGPFCPHYAREKRYAKAKLTQHAGWTVLGFWDSSGDTRPGSDSNFFMKGELDFEDALAEARRAFPEVIERCEEKYGPIELVQTVD